MNLQRLICTLVTIAAMTLTGCGGGSGGGAMSSIPPAQQPPASTPTPPASTGDPSAFDSTTTRTVGPSIIPDVVALQRGTPMFGSVAQNVYTAGSSPVRDVSTSFNGDRFTVNVSRQNGSSFTLDTDRDDVFDVIPYTPAENTVNNRPAVSGYIEGGNAGRYAGGAAFIEYSNTDFTDYLAAGWWVSIDLNTNPLIADAGAFIDGPDYDVANTSLPIMGTATYTGIGGGAYLAQAGTDTDTPGANETGEYAADISLTANFANMTISGYANNVVVFDWSYVLPDGTVGFDDGEVATNYRVNFGSAPINNNGTFVGNNIAVTNPDFNITQTQGSWAGQFSSVDDAGGNPRAAAGTNAAYFSTAGGSEAAFVGAWYGSTTPFE